MSRNGKPLHVLQLIVDRDRRGAQVFAVDLGAGLRALGATVETFALAPGAHGDRLPVQHLGTRRLGFRTLAELRRIAGDYDVVVAHGSSTLPASALALIGTGRPIVYRQISDPEVWAASWPRRIRSAAFLRRMDAVVALSAASSVTLKRHYWLHARPVVAVIPNAVPEGRFRPPSADERVEARRGLGLPDDAQVIVVVGALVAEKGIDFAIEASAQLPAAVLLVVGDGPDRPALQALAARRMPDRCLFVGALDDPRVAYWSGDVFVSPSLTEVMPAVLIEAGLCGLASVATDVGAVREVVEDQTTGLVVPSRNSEALVSAISLLMTDPSRRLEMGTAAAKRCSSRFTIAPVALMWLDLLYCVRTVGRTGSKR